MTHSDEPNPQPAARLTPDSSSSASSSVDSLPVAKATHNQSRADLVRTLEAMAVAGFITTAPAGSTTEATAPAPVAVSGGELR